MTTTDQADVNANLDERIAIWHTLDQLHGEALVAEGDRILAIVGRLCMQFEAPDLFRRIYATALDGCRLTQAMSCAFCAESRVEVSH